MLRSRRHPYYEENIQKISRFMSLSFREISKALGDSFSVNSIHVYPNKNQIKVSGTVLSLEPRTMHVLCYLVYYKQAVCTREDLIKAVWGDQYINKDSITRAISDLRKALGDHSGNPSFIKTIPKRGYMFIGELTHSTQKPVHQKRISLKPSTVYASSALAGILLLICTLLVLENFQEPTYSNKTITKSIPIIVRDTTGMSDSLLHKEIEAIVDVVVDEALRK